MTTPGPDDALALVHQGWDHLRRQRPLAAWACWQRALRLRPGDPAATQAIATLESAAELPEAARVVYRFRSPDDPGRRARWDERFRGHDRDREDLSDAADDFAAIVGDDPADAPAWFNLALCLAWQGRNAESVEALARVVALQARDRFDAAVSAWTLAEVLRQGAGAERLADDLRYAWVLEWPDGDAPTLPEGLPGLVAMPAPTDPINGAPTVAGAEVFEWLDRPIPDSADALRLRDGDDLPRLLATVVRTPRALRLSSPDPTTLDALQGPLAGAIGPSPPSSRREAAPLPLPMLDAAAWTFRLPRGLDPESERSLTRAGIEHFYEDAWIHQPRHGLGDRSPLEAARRARAGDDEARAMLAAVVRLREQLGARPRTAALYQGYPFDRLRRRLGLEPIDPTAIDAADLSCASEAELDALDPAALDGPRLIEACRSSLGLGDDARAARFASSLIDRDPPATPPLLAPLIRESMRGQRPDEALGWLARARARCEPRDRRTFDTWAAEIQARAGRPDEAARTYQSLLDDDPAGAATALDAAETLLDNEYPAHALPFLRLALDRAQKPGDHATAEKARDLLDRIGGDS